MKQPNLLANPKRKFSAKQIAAQKRFAAMAKAGKFRKRTKELRAINRPLSEKERATIKRAAKRNPRASGKWVVVWRTPWEGPQAKVFHGTPGGLNRASKFATDKQYAMIASRGGLDTAWGRKAYEELRDAFQEAFEGRGKSALVKFNKDLEIGFKFDTSETIKARRNPVKAGAKRRPPKRNPRRVYVVIKSGAGVSNRLVSRHSSSVDAAKMAEKLSRDGDGWLYESIPLAWLKERHKKQFGSVKRSYKTTSKRNPAEKFVIRAQRPVKSGYLYYYSRGDEFVKDAAHGDKFDKAAGEARMRQMLARLPSSISSITLVRA